MRDVLASSLNYQDRKVLAVYFLIAVLYSLCYHVFNYRRCVAKSYHLLFLYPTRIFQLKSKVHLAADSYSKLQSIKRYKNQIYSTNLFLHKPV